jgi:hypothetical protein
MMSEGNIVKILLYLIEHLKLHGAAIDYLPIKYTLDSNCLEMYGIWYDESLKKAVENCLKEFEQECEAKKHIFSLNCLPEEVLGYKLFKNARKFFFHDFLLDATTMRVVTKDSLQPDSQIKEL